MGGEERKGEKFQSPELIQQECYTFREGGVGARGGGGKFLFPLIWRCYYDE